MREVSQHSNSWEDIIRGAVCQHYGNLLEWLGRNRYAAGLTAFPQQSLEREMPVQAFKRLSIQGATQKNALDCGGLLCVGCRMRFIASFLLVFLLSGCNFLVYGLPQLNPLPRIAYNSELAAAKLGNSKAQAQVGDELYWACQLRDSIGWRPSCDPAALVKWNKAAATNGNAAAMFNLGAFYERNVFYPPNYADALIWYRKAANLGDAGAQEALSGMYQQGLGVKQDWAEACFWANVGGASPDYVRGLEKHLTRKQAAAVEQRVQGWKKGHPPSLSQSNGTIVPSKSL